MKLRKLEEMERLKESFVESLQGIAFIVNWAEK